MFFYRLIIKINNFVYTLNINFTRLDKIVVDFKNEKKGNWLQNVNVFLTHIWLIAIHIVIDIINKKKKKNRITRL